MPWERNYRSSLLQIFFKIYVLKNFANLAGKYLCWSLCLIKFQAWRPAALLRTDSYKCFPVKLEKFFRTPFLRNTFGGYFWNETYVSAAVLLHIRKRNLDWNESHEKKTKHIHVTAANLLHISIGNLDWRKCGHCKNEAREIDRLCCREVNAMLIASAKTPESEGSISPCRFHGELRDC